MKRMDSVSRSPINSLFGETLSGLSTIRAFRAQNRFVLQMQDFIDTNLNIFYFSTVTNR